MNHVLKNNFSCFMYKHSVAKLLPTIHVMNVLPMLKLLNTMKTFTPLMIFPIESFITNKSIYMEPVQDLNMNCRYIF
jgi:hypothetical protein